MPTKVSRQNPPSYRGHIKKKLKLTRSMFFCFIFPMKCNASFRMAVSVAGVVLLASFLVGERLHGRLVAFRAAYLVACRAFQGEESYQAVPCLAEVPYLALEVAFRAACPCLEDRLVGEAEELQKHWGLIHDLEPSFEKMVLLLHEQVLVDPQVLLLPASAQLLFLQHDPYLDRASRQELVLWEDLLPAAGVLRQ